MASPSRLIDVATAVADGASVNWPALETHSASEVSILGGLRLVERVAAVHASLPPVASFGNGVTATLASEIQSLITEAPPVWGPLTIVERIGSGTFSDVYLARDPRLDRPVALKLLRHRSRSDAGHVSDVIHEARVLAKISHPNVVTVHGADRIDGRVGLWMEFVDGRTLEQELRDRGPFPVDEVVRVGLDLCGALEAVHAAGVLHRDVKAQNVLRDRAGRVRLTDFGTGRETSDVGLGELAGTPLYLAPEVLAGGPASPASDVYSAGVLLYHLATGSFPVSGRSWRDLRDAHARGARVPVRNARAALPARAAAVIDRATSLDPARRYQSARDMAAALAAAAKGARRDRWLILAGIGVVVLAISAAWVVWHRRVVPPFRPREWVLVPAFESPLGDPQFNEGLTYALDRELGNSAYVNVVPVERIADALRLMKRPFAPIVDATTAWDVKEHDSGISRILQGRILPDGGGFDLSVGVSGRNGVVTVSYHEPAKTPAEFPVAVRHLANWVRLYLGDAPTSVQQDETRLEHTSAPSLAAVKAYSEGVAAAQFSNFPEAERQLRAAVAEDQNFASADVLLALVMKHVSQPATAYLPLLQRAVELAASRPARERDFILAANEWMTGPPAAALSAFEALARAYPDDAWRLNDLRFLYQSAARRDDADDVFIRVANLRPNDPFASIDAAEALLDSRGLAAARPFASRASDLLHETGATDPFLAPNNSLLQSPPNIWPRKSWLRLLLVHELWLERRPTEAAAALAAAEADPDVVGERSANYILGSLRLAFGQLRAAEHAFAGDAFAGTRALGQAEVALARGDSQAAVASVRSASEIDAAAFSVLIEAGRLADADALMSRISPMLQDRNRQWVTAELDAARGNGVSENTRQLLDAAVQFFAPIGGPRALLVSETLASALERAGDSPGAIRTLEATTTLRERIYAGGGHGGYFWMRCQARLAALYRKVGQIDKAHAIERDLLAELSDADADDALLLELKKRTP